MFLSTQCDVHEEHSSCCGMSFLLLQLDPKLHHPRWSRLMQSSLPGVWKTIPTSCIRTSPCSGQGVVPFVMQTCTKSTVTSTGPGFSGSSPSAPSARISYGELTVLAESSSVCRREFFRKLAFVPHHLHLFPCCCLLDFTVPCLCSCSKLCRGFGKQGYQCQGEMLNVWCTPLFSNFFVCNDYWK